MPEVQPFKVQLRLRTLPFLSLLPLLISTACHGRTKPASDSCWLSRVTADSAALGKHQSMAIAALEPEISPFLVRLGLRCFKLVLRSCFWNVKGLPRPYQECQPLETGIATFSGPRSIHRRLDRPDSCSSTGDITVLVQT